jgi:hypothetical protein
MFNVQSHSSMRYRAFVALYFLLLSLMEVLAGCGGNTSPAVTVQPTPANRLAVPIIPITAVDYGYEMPSNIDVRAGLVDIAMVDNGTQPHQTQVARLKPGVTLNQVLDEFIAKRDQAAAFSLLTLSGGPDIVSPGYGQETILRLPAGQYVLLCLVVGPDGIPHVNKGMIHFFTVAEDSAQGRSSPPQSDGEVMMTDSGYALPAVITQARALILQVTNQGSEPHEMNIVKLAGGKGIQDIAAFFQSPSGPPPFAEAGGMATLGASGSGWIKIHLDPGSYAALSFIPDQRTGKPQFELGVITQFTVR